MTRISRTSRAVAIMAITLITFGGNHARADEIIESNKIQSAESASPVNTANPLPGDVNHIIFFDFDSVELNTFADGIIASVIESAKETPVSEIIIRGHTDLSGSRLYNDRLSSRRAEAVKHALREHGLTDITISVKGLGEEAPLIATEDGVRQPQNRRAEVSLKSAPKIVSTDEELNGGDDEMYETHLRQEVLPKDAVLAKVQKEETVCQEISTRPRTMHSHEPLWGGWLSEVRLHDSIEGPRLHKMIATWVREHLA